ncbi:kinesin-like protein KIF28P [Branchiostoma lanceolatum]|uniref:kinesin-like protein KIF28P n=1 Tax=Branchiostoma lanceolatum TaxID=7740 RepID=UPI0034528A27
MSDSDSVKVAVRVRPFNQREKAANSKCILSMNGSQTVITDPATGNTKMFGFDQSYWSHDGFKEDDNGIYQGTDSSYADQRRVFNDLGQGVLNNAWAGYNAALFAYGQTGAGKSYSMVGYGINRGIVPITCDELFTAISKNEDKERQYQVSFSMLEIYNEKVRDLLSKDSKNLTVRQSPKQGFYVENLKQTPVQNYKEIERLMDQGTKNRTTASTNMNATSSRSHMVITVRFKQVFINASGESTTKSSEINLVDLAGSERASSTGATGDRLKEGSAINQSLSTLGNVISALADNSSGKKKVMVPYRNSVLTKLLQNALGGNSKTIMIAALSPADINYEETLSTLRYADRAKKIKNNAVVNESPTDRLIRELKEENARLMAKLQGQDRGGKGRDEELERMLQENVRQMSDIQMTWEKKLEEARREWEQSQAQVSKEDMMIKEHPYLQNVNEDPYLSGVVKHALPPGNNYLGNSKSETGNSIFIRGLGILACHVVMSNSGTEISIEPVSPDAKVVINGQQIMVKTPLQHLDRLMLGSNCLFLYVGYPADRINQEEMKQYSYDFFQQELAQSQGMTTLLGTPRLGEGANEAMDKLVFQDFVQLMPKVDEVNAMSKDMNKAMTFQPIIKNLASHDSLGNNKEMEVEVLVTNTLTNQVWMWSKAKFINRKFLIEELYQQYMEEGKLDVEQANDPFWDPVEDVFLGSAHIWLQSLAYRIQIDEQIEVHNYQGKEEAMVQVVISPADAQGRQLADAEAMVIDPSELLGKRLDFIISIPQCLGMKWIQEEKSRGSMFSFQFYGTSNTYRSKPVWHSLNAKMNFTQQFTINPVSMEFLQYLQTHALVLDMWGLQEGREEDLTSSSPQDGSDNGYGSSSTIQEGSRSSSFSDSDFEQVLHMREAENLELKKQMQDLEAELEKLRLSEHAAKKEKFTLLQQLEKLKTAQQVRAASGGGGRQPNSSAGSSASRTPPAPATQQKAPSSATKSMDGELAKAIKEFFSGLKPALQTLRELKETSGQTSAGEQADLQVAMDRHAQLVHKLDEDLSVSLTSLKANVVAAVKRKKEGAEQQS